jgi:hypothetical protein
MMLNGISEGKLTTYIRGIKYYNKEKNFSRIINSLLKPLYYSILDDALMMKEK